MARIDCDPFDIQEFTRWQRDEGNHHHGPHCEHCWIVWLKDLLSDFVGEEHRELSMADWD